MFSFEENSVKHGTTEGVYRLSGGEVGYTFAERRDGVLCLRYEHACYVPYLDDGNRADGTKNRNIVSFEPLSWTEAKAKYPDISGGFKP